MAYNPFGLQNSAYGLQIGIINITNFWGKKLSFHRFIIKNFINQEMQQKKKYMKIVRSIIGWWKETWQEEDSCSMDLPGADTRLGPNLFGGEKNRM